ESPPRTARAEPRADGRSRTRPAQGVRGRAPPGDAPVGPSTRSRATLIPSAGADLHPRPRMTAVGDRPFLERSQAAAEVLRVQIQGLADPQEREHRGAIVAPQPVVRSPLFLLKLRPQLGCARQSRLE